MMNKTNLCCLLHLFPEQVIPFVYSVVFIRRLRDIQSQIRARKRNFSRRKQGKIGVHICSRLATSLVVEMFFAESEIWVV